MPPQVDFAFGDYRVRECMVSAPTTRTIQARHVVSRSVDCGTRGRNKKMYGFGTHNLAKPGEDPGATTALKAAPQHISHKLAEPHSR